MDMALETKLTSAYASEIAIFEKFCRTLPPGSDEGCFREINFYDLSIGFFIALGVTKNTLYPDEDEPFCDAFHLAILCRYTYQYWQPVPSPSTPKKER